MSDNHVMGATVLRRSSFLLCVGFEVKPRGQCITDETLDRAYTGAKLLAEKHGFLTTALEHHELLTDADIRVIQTTIRVV